jgi:hypothetical protein
MSLSSCSTIESKRRRSWGEWLHVGLGRIGGALVEGQRRHTDFLILP